MKRAFFFLFFSTVAFADPKAFYFERVHRAREAVTTDSVVAGIFTQKLNHDDPADTRTFEQRYYLEDAYATSPNAPVIFFLCGESTCTPNHLGGAVREHAKQQKAYLVALEHRYYGKSQPFPELTTENLRFLSTGSALKDAAAFQKWLTKKLDLTGRWAVVGGSYPGSLAAYYRLAYPELVVGALASSAPVKAEANFEAYDKHVATVAGPECLARIQLAVKTVEKALDNPQALSKLKADFQAETLTENLDFVYLVADMAALAIQYGYKDRFCALLGEEDPLAGYARFTREIYQSWGINALSLSAEGALSLDPASYEAAFGMRQWFYQSCTEYGYWQNAYHDPSLSARSALINADYHQNLCKRLFGIETPVNTSHINDKYYEPLLESDVSNVYFTNGDEDPWMNLSIAEELGNTTNANHVYTTITGAAHCDDLGSPRPSDSAELKTARERFSQLLEQWLN